MTLVAIKPHLVYLFWLALFLWVVNERQWRLIAGLIVAGIIVVSIPLLFNAGVYFRYLELIQTGDVLQPLDWATPSLGTALAELLTIRGMWIRWLPSFAGGLWLLWYWSRRAADWDWIAETPLILLVSLATSSFAWTFDHIVLLPAVIQCAAWTARGDKAQRGMIIGIHLVFAAIMLVGKVWVRDDFWYFWVAPTFLVFYLYVRASVATRQ